ncbi:MAG: substrate-binding domain-containing protein [Phycisphaeraceae bacterium]
MAERQNPPARPRVALIISPATAHGRGTLAGVRGYIREHGSWYVTLAEHSITQPASQLLQAWRPDGIIARLESEELRELVMAKHVPTIEVGGHRDQYPLPMIHNDDDAIGRMGAEHLIGLGHRHFGFLTDTRFRWSTERCEAFVEAVASPRRTCSVFDRAELAEAGATLAEQRHAVAQWIQTLPEVVGVMAMNDILAQQIAEAARLAQRSIPDNFAVLGVDDDEVICDLTEPPLSSVVPDSYRIGYTAAQQLERMMRGESVSPKPVKVRPLRVARRRSTDAVVVDDPAVAQAVAYIREHACQGITVTDVLEQVDMTRRMLDARFTKLIGRTPYQEILRIKLNRAKVLLTETTLPLSRIAAATGFKEAECLSVAFKRTIGQTPGRYRSEHAASAGRHGKFRPRYGRAKARAGKKEDSEA